MINEEAVRKSRKAQQILDDEILSLALNKIENDALWQFKSSKPADTAMRESAYNKIRSVEDLRTELAKLIDDGKVAQRAIERAQKN